MIEKSIDSRHASDDSGLPLETMDTAALVEVSRRGDSKAFGILCQNFERMVFTIALGRLGNAHDAQELTQEVFVQAFVKLDQLESPAALGSWLKTITHRMAINRMIRNEHLTPMEEELLQAKQVECGNTEKRTPLLNVLEAERAEMVQNGMASLGQMDQEALFAFYYKGLSLHEMSEELHAPLGTIKRRLHVARNRLGGAIRDYIEGHDQDEETAHE